MRALNYKIILLLVLGLHMACVSQPQATTDDESAGDNSDLSSKPVDTSKPIDEVPYPTGGDEPIVKNTFTVSFPGLPFSGGAVTGEGINCNRTDGFDCNKAYEQGSRLAFRIPTSIIADGQSLTYAGEVDCNGQRAQLAASGSYVEFVINSLEQDYECSFFFQ